jgi:hypothetical protein
MVLLAVTATAATGSPNPVVWAERAGTTLQTVGHTPEPAPSAEPTSDASHRVTAAPAQPTHEPESEAKEPAEPKEAPEPRERAEPAEPAGKSEEKSGDH